MARYALMSLASPMPGQAEAYKVWHEHHHVPEVLAVPGVLNCRRFETAGCFAGDGRWSLMSIYDIETEDFDGLLEELKRRLAEGAISSTPLGDPDRRLLLSWQLLTEHEMAE
jgi:hypothetical protein